MRPSSRLVPLLATLLLSHAGPGLADALPGVGRFDCRITTGGAGEASGEPSTEAPQFLQLMVMGSVVRAFGAEGVDGAYEVTERVEGDHLTARRTVDAAGSGLDAELRIDLASRAVAVSFTDAEGAQRSLGGDCAAARDY